MHINDGKSLFVFENKRFQDSTPGAKGQMQLLFF